jgi:hypothetical protein
MNKRHQTGYMILVIMIATSVILIAFSFWMLRKRTDLPLPGTTNSETTTATPEYEWAEFSGSGIVFKYPKNIFTAETKVTKAGTVTRVFLGTGEIGTITANIISRQFDPDKIIDPGEGVITDAQAIRVAGQIGYQYQTRDNTCAEKTIQIPFGGQIAALVFGSCDSDPSPKLLENPDLMLQILNEVKLTPTTSATSETDEEESMDTLPDETSDKSVIQTQAVIADDSGTNPSTLNVKKNAIVEITFTVASSNVLSGGLEFKSSVVNSGAILAGTSKTVSFKATESFEFTVYGSSGGSKKDYTIKVNVK